MRAPGARLAISTHDRRPVDGLPHRHDRRQHPDLVRLQVADEVHLRPIRLGTTRGGQRVDLGDELLGVVLADRSASGRHRGPDGLDGERLRHRDQLDLAAPGGRDARPDRSDVVGDGSGVDHLLSVRSQ